MKTTAILILSLLFFQCSAKKEATQPHYTINDIWVLEELSGFEHSMDSVNKRPTLEVHLSDSRYLGNSSCNNYQGKVVVNENKIKFNAALMTKMFCDKNYGLENAYMQALEKTNSYRIEKLQLFLMNGEEIVAIFKKVD